MPGLFLVTPGTRVSLSSEKLHIEAPAQRAGDDADLLPRCRDIPLVDIEHVVLTEHVSLTMPAIAELLRRNISVILTSHGERIIGLCMPPAPNNPARLAQYKRAEDARFALALGVNWVEAKILNSRRVLQRLAANREDVDVSAKLRALEQTAERCKAAESLDTLRGYEGTAAGTYFEALGSFFPDGFPFERRSRRPPHNAANAVLSYAYTIMAAEIECCVHAAGMDPAIGFLHELAERRASLALDIMEPFRAPVADAMALDLASHGTLKAKEHFEPREGGIYLNTDGRKRFFVAYERRMNREFFNEHTGARSTLRDEFHNQVLAVKKAVLDGEAFEPFLMN